MNQRSYIILKVAMSVLCLSLLLCSCKKQKLQSDSDYNNAYLWFLKYRDVVRSGNAPDSITEEYFAGARFGDSSDLNQFRKTVGSVWINNINFGDPVYHNKERSYYYSDRRIGDSSQGYFDNAVLKVISPNGFPDILYNIGNTQLYGYIIPDTIRRNDGLTLPINKDLLPNADSMQIFFDNIHTTLSTNSGQITFTPEVLNSSQITYPDSGRWYHYIKIRAFKIDYLNINGKGFKVIVDKTIRYSFHLY